MKEDDPTRRRKTLLLALLAAAAFTIAVVSIYRSVAPPQGRVIGVDAGPGKAGLMAQPR